MTSEGTHDPVKALLDAQATAEMWRVQAGKWAAEARICSTFVRRMADTSTHYAIEARAVLKALDEPRETLGVLYDEADVAKILDGFDKGIFGRDITNDLDSGWAVRLLPYLAALGRLAQARSEATAPTMLPAKEPQT